MVLEWVFDRVIWQRQLGLKRIADMDFVWQPGVAGTRPGRLISQALIATLLMVVMFRMTV